MLRPYLLLPDTIGLMFIGHFAVGFGGKRIARRASLGTLFLAAQFLDLLWPTFLLLGLESVRVVQGITPFSPMDFVSYPFTHSLIASIGWSVLFGHVYFVLTRRGREAIVLAFCVLSHWILDFATHRPDLPLGFAPASARVGLGLWFHPRMTLAVESLMFLAGVLLYGRATVAKDRAGTIGFWALVIFLFVAYLAASFGPPPPNVTALAWGAQSLWLLVIWGYWLDKHRQFAVQ